MEQKKMQRPLKQANLTFRNEGHRWMTWIICILDYQLFILLVLVVPLIASLAFENLLEFGCSLVGIIERCPLVLPTVSNTTPAIE